MEQHQPPWSLEGRGKVALQLQTEVAQTYARKPAIARFCMVPVTNPSASVSIYLRLNESQSEIRLLELFLTGDDTPVTCNLITTSLTKNPEFVALSYEWGEATNTEEILLNGHSFHARRNLVIGLRKIKQLAMAGSSGKQALRLWVDAICINQKDTSERSSQVQLMRPIYSKATSVLSWMGDDPDHALAIQALRGITKNIQVTKNEELLWLQAMPTLWGGHYWIDTSSDKATKTTGSYIWDALTKFANHSYWLRTWIVQEIVLGKTVILLAGEETVDVDDLDDFTGHLQQLQLQSRPCPYFIEPVIWQVMSSNFHAWTPVRQVTNMRWQNQRGKLGSWGLNLVPQTRGQRATDPRDRIFSMLGLAHLGIKADYSRSVESVYCEFAQRWLGRGKNIEDLLVSAGCGVHEWQEIELPSWVPDWSMVQTLSNFKPSLYSAGGNPHFFRFLAPAIRLSISGTCLTTPGVIATTVKLRGNVNGMGLEGSKQHWEFCTQYLARQTADTYPTGIPFLQAFFRVAIRDRDLLKTDQLLSTSSSTFYIIALGFLRTIIEAPHHASGRHIDQTLDSCLPQIDLSSGTLFAKSFSKNFLGGTSPYVDAWTSAEDAIVSHPAIYSGLMVVMVIVYAENYDKRFFETANGLLGLGPRGMRDGDLVGVFGGCNLPVILRKVESQYLFVGSCFVLGMMKGEVLSSKTLARLGGLQMLEIC